ncbi:MAG TPA: triphosphoribosyl-dephospho-CoA synthase CitG [Bacillota bacterium]|nr:triphosphoribosyl-dephospho-CoA synthase CitG [Bacillota bacterium]
MKVKCKDKEFIKLIREAAQKAILYEVAATPKPGLIDRNNSGAHKDMDFFTFMASAAALSNVFAECAVEGLQYPSLDFAGLLQKIRPIGMEAEQRMFRATGGVNTHKGLIFSLGIVCAAAGSIFRKSQNPRIPSLEISRRVKEMTAGISERELKGLIEKKTLTTGERLYVKYGLKGIRGQAESGFEALLKAPITVLREMIDKKLLPINDILVHVLMYLMSDVEDTNVIGRHNLETLRYVQDSAKKALDLGGMLTKKGKDYIYAMDNDFIRKGISPGGSADLLAVTVMMYLLESGKRI